MINVKSWLTNKQLPVAVFVSGAAVMMYELLASRWLSPFLGTSTIIWTSIIGLIMASLSVGYMLGGRLADRRLEQRLLAFILLLASLLIVAMLFYGQPLLHWLSRWSWSLQGRSVLAAALLFAPASVLLGMVSPYAVRLRLHGLTDSGRTIGDLYALSTAGSIVGTFAAGFWLLPLAGTLRLTWLVAVLLAVIGFWLWPHKRSQHYLLAVLLAALLWAIDYHQLYRWLAADAVDTDTSYARVWVFDFEDKRSGKMAKLMRIDAQSSSAMFLDSNEPVFAYAKFYRLARYFKPDTANALMIGGAAYTVPNDLLSRWPTLQLDVVEIDPGVTKLAKEHFRLLEQPRLRIFHQDARVFLNDSQQRYDAILGDAFSNFISLPAHLTTLETVRAKHRALADDGVVIVNLIGSLAGPGGQFIRAEYATYRQVFPQVYLLPVEELSAERRQNIMLVALKSEQRPDWLSSDPDTQAMLDKRWTGELATDMPVLTDDYAPVDWYVSKLY